MIPSDCIPTSEKETVCEYLRGPDSLGRYHFALYWLTDYIPGYPYPSDGPLVRGQHFFGSPSQYHERHITNKGTWRDVEHRFHT